MEEAWRYAVRTAIATRKRDGYNHPWLIGCERGVDFILEFEFEFEFDLSAGFLSIGRHYQTRKPLWLGFGKKGLARVRRRRSVFRRVSFLTRLIYTAVSEFWQAFTTSVDRKRRGLNHPEFSIHGHESSSNHLDLFGIREV